MAARRIEEDDIFAGFTTVKISAVEGDGLRQLKNRIIAMTYPPVGATTTRGGQTTADPSQRVQSPEWAPPS